VRLIATAIPAVTVVIICCNAGGLNSFALSPSSSLRDRPALDGTAAHSWCCSLFDFGWLLLLSFAAAANSHNIFRLHVQQLPAEDGDYAVDVIHLGGSACSPVSVEVMAGSSLLGSLGPLGGWCNKSSELIAPVFMHDAMPCRCRS
jgi:hypothetical protein